ncbi:Pyridoxal-phosphate dependent enzyme [Piscibacillus halophilus]|uniref:Pyridoxal-phosphate dependent enzyme n=1 Tax=Piscibacillus halophilus TaxID=571933 RepID=A0A1H9DSH9_9BACI|nr:Pyridoxal-phosphate dependent enzyme [Piscibacillus halophilus]
MVGVEPELGHDTKISLEKGEVTSVSGTDQTIADGLRTTQPGDLTFPILQKYMDDLVLVSEDDIRYAMSFVMERMKQLIESKRHNDLDLPQMGAGLDIILEHLSSLTYTSCHQHLEES